jgi:hypothetical protein
LSIFYNTPVVCSAVFLLPAFEKSQWLPAFAGIRKILVPRYRLTSVSCFLRDGGNHKKNFEPFVSPATLTDICQNHTITLYRISHVCKDIITGQALFESSSAHASAFRTSGICRGYVQGLLLCIQ